MRRVVGLVGETSEVLLSRTNKAEEIARALEMVLEPYQEDPSLMMTGMAITLGMLCGTYMRDGKVPQEIVNLAIIYAEVARTRIQPILTAVSPEVAQAMLEAMHLSDEEIH